jgi:hypothetical protein
VGGGASTARTLTASPSELGRWYLNGYVSEHGRQVGVPTPFNDKVVELITRGPPGVHSQRRSDDRSSRRSRDAKGYRRWCRWPLRLEPRDLGRIVIEHLGGGIDAETAEGEGDPAGGRVRLEGRRVDRVGPVRLRGDEGAAGLPERLDPAEARESSEVGVVRVQFSLVLDGQRRELSVRREIPGSAKRPQQPERSVEMVRTRHDESHMRSRHPPLDVPERVVDAQRAVEDLSVGSQADESEEGRGTAGLRVLGEACDVRVQEQVHVGNDQGIRRRRIAGGATSPRRQAAPKRIVDDVLERLSKSMDFLFDQADYVGIERQRRPGHGGIMMRRW